MLYRIYTERFEARDARHGKPESIISATFEGFTRFDSVGYWQGTRELSECFEVVTDDAEAIRAAAQRICRTCGQDAVLVLAVPCTMFLIDGQAVA